MTGLIVPLSILILVFAGIQLGNEMSRLNDSYQIKSRFAFESLQSAIKIALQNAPETFRNEANLESFFGQLKDSYEGIEVDVYSLLDHAVIFGDHPEWDAFDEKAVELSLFQKQQGKPYIIRVNKSSQKLNCYIPVAERQKDVTLIVRAQFPLANVKEALANSRWTLTVMVILIVLTGAAIGYKLSRSIVRPIKTLNAATQEIVKGNLGKHVDIQTGDEIEILARTFNKMSDSLKEMQQKAQDSNPLTHLPGNQGIFQDLKKRIMERQKFVLFHTDLDRFKVFNDHFGLAKGDDAIKMTADLLKKALKEKGGDDDFIGHQGGDDFVVITRPQRAVAIGDYICAEFEKVVVKALYPKEDYERGYTMQIDRRRLAETGEEVLTQFPLLAVSLAGVSNVKKDFADYFECMSAAVTVKKEVKKTIESSYLIKE